MSATYALVFGLLLGVLFVASDARSAEVSDSGDSEDEFELIHDPQWPSRSVQLGQVGGVSFDNKGNAVVFHRASRTWGRRDFDGNGVYTKAADGKIAENTLVSIDASGKSVDAWGANLFYMPHGLTIDSENNVWVTDVAAHQVFKFAAGDKQKPALVLGEALKPGSDATHFCQPTDVAVASNGDFFVADGYCNSRLLKFDRNGKLLATFTTDPDYDESASSMLPHSLALLEDKDLVCAADRENGRVLCFDAGLRNASNAGKMKGMLTFPGTGIGRIYAIAYDKAGNKLHGVTVGFGRRKAQAFGFTVDLDEPRALPVIAKWTARGFVTPHDIAVDADGQNVLVGDVATDGVHMFRQA